MYSIDGGAWEWFWSLATGTISSLKELHEAFHYYSKGLYSSESMLHNCCEEFKIYIQNEEVDSFGSVEKEVYEEFEKNVVSNHIQEDTILSFLHITQNEEYVEHDIPPFEINGSMFFLFDSCDNPIVLATRFTPFDFFSIHGLPNDVLAIMNGETSSLDSKKMRKIILHNTLSSFMKVWISCIYIMRLFV